MTILQLKYVITLAASPSMREAAIRLYISQPALSASIKDLEDELGIVLFSRNNKGISLTEEGSEFLAYAKQAVSQYQVIEDKYTKKANDKRYFSVSMQHYVFAVQAFVDVVEALEDEKYTYSVHETRTDEVLTDVRDLRSEVGVIGYTKGSETILKKLFREYQLDFTPLMTRDTVAYVWKEHPLSDRSEVSIEELMEYPLVSFDQKSDSEFYISEEPLSDHEYAKLIKSNDRATSSEIMAKLNGYSLGTGAMTDSITLKGQFIAIKVKEEDPITIGYIVRKNHKLGEFATAYIEQLSKYKD